MDSGSRLTRCSTRCHCACLQTSSASAQVKPLWPGLPPSMLVGGGGALSCPGPTPPLNWSLGRSTCLQVGPLATCGTRMQLGFCGCRSVAAPNITWRLGLLFPAPTCCCWCVCFSTCRSSHPHTPVGKGRCSRHHSQHELGGCCQCQRCSGALDTHSNPVKDVEQQLGDAYPGE